MTIYSPLNKWWHRFVKNDETIALPSIYCELQGDGMLLQLRLSNPIQLDSLASKIQLELAITSASNYPNDEN